MKGILTIAIIGMLCISMFTSVLPNLMVDEFSDKWLNSQPYGTFQASPDSSISNWSQTYGQGLAMLNCLVQTNDGGYVFCYSENTTHYSVSTPTEFNAFLVKVDSSGNVQWKQTFDSVMD